MADEISALGLRHAGYGIDIEAHTQCNLKQLIRRGCDPRASENLRTQRMCSLPSSMLTSKSSQPLLRIRHTHTCLSAQLRPSTCDVSWLLECGAMRQTNAKWASDPIVSAHN
eukprot:2389309-Amphidinium_carterae.1